MNKTCVTVLASTLVGSLGAAAHAELVTGTVTADNHYAIYSSLGDVFTYHGGNEIGAGGEPGQYNWSIAESYSFEAGEFLYIAAWSDDAVAQGLLAQFQSASLGSIYSGDSRWQVYGTNINRGDGDPHPSATEIAGHVGFAGLNALWESVHVGGNNGIAPWDTIAGISGDARWMWQNVPGDPDPLMGGSGAAEMLIFRTTVPAPGAIAFLGLGCMRLRRRRI